ncbi:MAG TPA: class I SAM-dependent methyltransferase [Gaiellaceae bacterium]|nr:class I SAM-dependent methyltransferase [Gaiellaceae bacterium]
MEEPEAWNAGADAWVALVRESAHGEAHDTVLRELLPPPGGAALDVGCGEGRWTRYLAAAGWRATGVDRSEALVAKARDANPGGDYLVGEAASLPVADASVDVVLCVNVLMHVVELDAAVGEIQRVLSEGGVAVIGLGHPVAEAGTYDEERDELRVARYFAAEEHPIPLGHGHVAHQHRTIEGYVRAFLGAGLALDDLREVPGRTGSTPRYLDLRLRK